APPGQGAAGRGATLVVGIASPASVAWLDDGPGRHGSALAGLPEQIAAGPGGSVVALTAGSAGGGRRELEVVAPRRAAEYHAAGLSLGGLETSGVAWLAADGRRYAVVAYQRRRGAHPPAGTASPTDGARCPLLVVDLLVRESVSATAPCRAGERVRSLALEPGGGLHRDGPLPAVHAYVGLEGSPYERENGAGRLVVLALPSGAVVGSLALSGTPADLRLASSSRGAPAALYVLEQSGGAGDSVPTPEWGRVLVVDPLTLDVRGQHALSAHASRLVPASDGQSVFLVHHDIVQRLDLPTGKLRQIARLPGRVVAAEILGDRLYLASPEARALWVLDTRTGYRRPDLRLAGHPVSLVPATRWAR
ncbi:MAG: hypothetical protein ACRDJN_22145, partial [Chloroflexota bacterium]